jgi:hypothetical protein
MMPFFASFVGGECTVIAEKDCAFRTFAAFVGSPLRGAAMLLQSAAP